MTTVPAGWYAAPDPDPNVPNQLRYWDGNAWTEHRHPVAAAPVVEDQGTAEQTRTQHGVPVPGPYESSPSGGSSPTMSISATTKKKPWYKRGWGMTLIGVFALLVIMAGISGGEEDAGKKDATSASSPSVDPSVAAAEKKAEEDKETRAKAALRDPKSYKAISPREFKLVVKDPDSHIGEKYVIYGNVTQFDTATGDDTFLADTGPQRKYNWYDYDTNTLARTDDAKVFAKVVEDDMVTMYVEIYGSESYDTQIGGNTTVPVVKVNIIKVTGSSG